MSEFIHLHNHSHYSLLDAICTTDGLIDTAIENQMPAIALTDHGVMFGAMEFYIKAKAKGIKPIIGCEIYIITKGSRFDKSKETFGFESGFVGKSDPFQSKLNSRKTHYDHLVLLAKNETGYKNLIKLTSIGHTEGFYYKPRIDVEILRKYSEGLVALSACAGGIVASSIVKGDLNSAKESAIIYKEIFDGDFYLEIQNHGIDIEKPILEYMPKIAKETGLKLIATNDIHYIKHEHHIPHNIFLYINTDLSRDRGTVDVETDMRYGTDQVYFKTADEMCNLFKDYPEAIASTLEVNEKCNLELTTGVYHMPNFPIPTEANTNNLDDYLEKLSLEGLHNKIKNAGSREEERIKHELSVIKQMNFSGYFLIVADFVKYAKENKIYVGPGRGSAAGSLVCYSLGITNVNPLDYNLFFERFLNPERISMPDIDIDFQDDKRDNVINYSRQKYGENSVSQIVTFNKLKTKAVLKDVGRVLNYPFDTINEITKHVPSIFGKVKSLQECYNEIPDFKNYFDEVPDRKKLLRYAIVLENLIKNMSMHASGVVITPSDISDFTPICKTPQLENQYMTQYDMIMLEKAGLIKMDFLGLKELKILEQTIELIRKRKDIVIDLETLSLDDEKTYELFSSGQTLGIFQFAKDKTREYLTQLKPRNINDLAAMNALNRPGPMDLIPDFIERKHGRKEITYIHPRIEEILKETYGIIVYQEQVMQIVREVAGYSLAKADIVRRAMGKKDDKLMKEQEKEFISGAAKNGFDKKIAKEIFKLILKFADYGFNKSHSVAYSILAYHTAYLKIHYPLEFITTLLNCRKDDKDEMVLMINECRKMKIKLTKPDINRCFSDFTIDDTEENCILFGLSSIKNIGKSSVDYIVKEREENGLLENFVDFCTRIDTKLINKKAVESLIYAGAFDLIDNNRKKLFENYEMIMQKFGIRSSGKSGEQSSLFGGIKSKLFSNILDSPEYQCEDWTESEKLSLEKSVLGLYLSSHPLSGYESEINRLSTVKLNELTDMVIENNINTKPSAVRICGVISNFRVKQSKRGNQYATFILEDFTGQGECILFQNKLEACKSFIRDEIIVCVTARCEENTNTVKLIVDEITPLKKIENSNGHRSAHNITIKVFSDKFDLTKFNDVKTMLEKYRGNCNLYFDIYKNEREHTLLEIPNLKIGYNESLEILFSQVFGKENIIIN